MIFVSSKRFENMVDLLIIQAIWKRDLRIIQAIWKYGWSAYQPSNLKTWFAYNWSNLKTRLIWKHDLHSIEAIWKRDLRIIQAIWKHGWFAYHPCDLQTLLICVSSNRFENVICVFICLGLYTLTFTALQLNTLMSDTLSLLKPDTLSYASEVKPFYAFLYPFLDCCSTCLCLISFLMLQQNMFPLLPCNIPWHSALGRGHKFFNQNQI